MHNCVLYKRGMEEGQSLERRFMCCEDVVDTYHQTVVGLGTRVCVTSFLSN